MTDKERFESLCEILRSFATTEHQSSECEKYIRQISGYGFGSFKSALFAIFDGVRYGNWPWVDFKALMDQCE